MQKGSSCYKFQCLFLMLLFYFLAEGPAVAPCTKDYCTSSWTWSIYSCNNIYSSNRGSPIIKFLFIFSNDFYFLKLIVLRYISLSKDSFEILCRPLQSRSLF